MPILSKLEFTPDREAILRKTVITDTAPGVIVHDFQVLLDFVAHESTYLTDSQMLPLKVLAPLNERLLRQIEHGLQRPQQKTFPHINGLFLLLRASGLTTVDATGRKPMLVADMAVLESWNALSASERYFALFESWFMRGDDEIVGERRRLDIEPPFFIWAEFMRMLVDNNWYGNDWNDRVRYRPGLHNLAIMELLGLVKIENGPVEAKQGWRIGDVQTTQWGETLLAMLLPKLGDNWAFWDQLAHPYNIPAGALKPYIQPFRPDWQRTLLLPGREFQPGIFVFKAALDVDLWREIIIPAASTLEDLSDAILSAYDFDDDHLYRYLYPTRFGIVAEVLHSVMDQGPYVHEVRIGDLPAQPGFQMVFNFDFGDNWRFNVLLDRIDPPEEFRDRYRIGDQEGESPEQYPSWDWDEVEGDY